MKLLCRLAGFLRLRKLFPEQNSEKLNILLLGYGINSEVNVATFYFLFLPKVFIDLK